ncbi:MAG: response regulator transcription factor [Alphaproteobacteria bacterium]|nr:response regulator transcription factor [Alphaproteobacteria bacterium]MCB9692854.1 response regulator transcription factor [Alphaproteobacteria bacterium]
MPTILLIDDDASLLDGLAMAVEDAGHEVITAPDGARGWALATDREPDLVISDVNMPGLDGFSLCRKLRDAGAEVPIILLTARDNEIDEALGLELGADDYISKPFSTRVVLARVSALLRRQALRAGGGRGSASLEAGQLTMDPERLEARWAGTLFETTVTEFRMLEAMASRPGIVLSRGRLLELTRDDDSVVAERIVDTYVRRLRRKLEAIDTAFDSIETVIGAGYKWRNP